MPFNVKTDKYKVISTDPEGVLLKELARLTEPVLTKEDTNVVKVFTGLIGLSTQLNDNALSDPKMQELIKDPNTKFDLVMVQPFLASEGGYYLAHRFKAAAATYVTAQSHLPFVSHSVGQPFNPSYISLPMLPFVGELNFIQRVINTFACNMFEYVFRNIVMLRNVNWLLDKHFPGESRPDILELERSVSVVFQFGHPLILDGWAPMVPNYVQLGMMNCRPGIDFAPKDPIGDFLNNSKNGVVYMSFGTVIQGRLMTKETKQMFLNMFNKFSQYDFIWKFDEDLPNVPKNVLVSNWLPQQDILAHPKLKVFITHVGQSSFQETLCHQKPVLAIPVTGDQPINALEAEKMGIGIALHYADLKENELMNALDQVLHDKKYLEAAQAMGSALNDQITRPLDRAVWWIEHVMRHPKMYEGKSPVHKLAWYQYYLLDVLLFFATLIYILFTLLRFIFYKCCSRKSKVKDE